MPGPDPRANRPQSRRPPGDRTRRQRRRPRCRSMLSRWSRESRSLAIFRRRAATHPKLTPGPGAEAPGYPRSVAPRLLCHRRKWPNSKDPDGIRTLRQGDRLLIACRAHRNRATGLWSGSGSISREPGRDAMRPGSSRGVTPEGQGFGHARPRISFVRFVHFVVPSGFPAVRYAGIGTPVPVSPSPS